MLACTILYTSDFHNRLNSQAAARIRNLRASLSNVLLLDAGDAIGAGNLSARLGGEPILRLMADAGYDAMALGNRESHPYYRILKCKLREAKFPILAANLRAVKKPLPPMVTDHLIKPLPNGMKVGIIGLASQMTKPDSWWSRFTDYVFDDPIKTATGLVGKMRGQCDLLICLSHLGQEADRELASVPGINVIVGGHSHLSLDEPESRGDCLLVYAGSHAKSMGKLDLEVAEGEIKSAQNRLIDL